jgi:hypothetical protein
MSEIGERKINGKRKRKEERGKKKEERGKYEEISFTSLMKK